MPTITTTDGTEIYYFPHGMPTTEAETINRDILAFIKQPAAALEREPVLV